MTSTEEVPHVSCSIGARQAEPPAPEKGLVHVFSLQHANFDWPYFGLQARQAAHMWRGCSMTSAEGVPRIPSSIGARQAEPPVPKMASCTSFRFNRQLRLAVFRPPGPPRGSHVEGSLYDEY